MTSDYEADLETLAEGRKYDDAKWPGLLEEILLRIEKTAKDFPIPKIPLPEPPPFNVKSEDRVANSSPEPHEPPEKRARLDGSTNEVKDQPKEVKAETNNIPPPTGTLPPQLLSLIQSIQSTLRDNFTKSPPHTSQRLAELILQPRKHYRSLPSYLRALDRIVTVASPISAYPLPSTGGLGNGDPNALFNGTVSPAKDQNDEDFIGGAELTPIPWLRESNPSSPTINPSASDLRTESTSMIDGPNGAGSVETVSVNVNGVPNQTDAHGVTQGELIRQEQEAGITPVPNTNRASDTGMVDRATATGDLADGDKAEEEEPVHARGPNVIGMEDMGPQAPGSGLERGIEIERPLDYKRDGANDATTNPSTNDDECKDGGTDVADADGAVEGEKDTGERRVEAGADGIDSTAR